jgi:hypothetical protein
MILFPFFILATSLQDDEVTPLPGLAVPNARVEAHRFTVPFTPFYSDNRIVTIITLKTKISGDARGSGYDLNSSSLPGRDAPGKTYKVDNSTGGFDVELDGELKIYSTTGHNEIVPSTAPFPRVVIKAFASNSNLVGVVSKAEISAANKTATAISPTGSPSDFKNIDFSRTITPTEERYSVSAKINIGP